MADHYTQFSCLFDVGSAANATAAMVIRDQLEADLERDGEAGIGFDLAIEAATGPGMLWISSDEYGEPEHVLAFVIRCAEAFDLQGTWGFCWANTCSRPRLDGFGGGAQVVNLTERTCLTWIDLAEWVLQHTDDPVAADNGDGPANTEPTGTGETVP